MQSLNRQQIAASCLSRWQHEDERTEYFSTSFETWVDSIPRDSIDMIFQLLSAFCYYPHEIVNRYLVKLHKDLIAKGTITDENTIFISIKTTSGIGNSSNDYWVEYKLQNKINKHTCIDDIRRLLPEQVALISNVVIIDDCSGTGNTLTKYLSRNLDLFSNKNIYFITIHLMKKALDNINKFAQEKKMKICVLFAMIQDKAFNDKYFAENQSFKEQFIDVSLGLNIHKDHILGFEESEGLFAFYNNTPNNTLGLFWHDTENYRSLFPRRNDKKPAWMNFKAQRKNRKKQNYYSAQK